MNLPQQQQQYRRLVVRGSAVALRCRRQQLQQHISPLRTTPPIPFAQEGKVWKSTTTASPAAAAATAQETIISNTNRSSSSNTTEPFYGRPRESSSYSSFSLSSSHSIVTHTLPGRIALAVHSAATALADPTRADAVAALGDISSSRTLRKIRDRMRSDPVGRQLLIERPLVSKATIIPYERLMAEAAACHDNNKNDDDDEDSTITFGQAYGRFLISHGFDPDARDEVKYLPVQPPQQLLHTSHDDNDDNDDELAYILTRYRQCHDFWHALTGLPPTVLGELGIKWLELFQTGLPVAALSCTVGSLKLSPAERDILWTQYLPWALRQQSQSQFLMNVYYEKEFDTNLEELRRRLHLEKAPTVLL